MSLAFPNSPQTVAGGGRWRAGAAAVIRYGPVAVIAPLVGYLELKPLPSLRGIPHVPNGLMHFVDHHDFLNNVVGFGALAGSVHLAFAGWKLEMPGRVGGRAGVVAATVVIMELIQLALPKRTCDWHDVAAGWLGIGLMSLPWVRTPRPLFPHGL